MMADAVDRFVGQWEQQRPDLDASGLGVVSRVLRLAKHLEQSADRALDPFGLTLWQFDVLAALRRSGAPYTLTPSDLLRQVTLTSGAMTNRIDRLEDLGYVARGDDPNDRRGVRISLTPRGLAIVDAAIESRLEEATRHLVLFSAAERRVLTDLLRRILLSFERAEPVPRGNGEFSAAVTLTKRPRRKAHSSASKRRVRSTTGGRARGGL